MSVSDDDLPKLPVLEPGVYKHYKGKRYEVIAVAMHSETLEPLVAYKPLYETKVPIWVRPYGMFVETVEVDGITVPRFKKLN